MTLCSLNLKSTIIKKGPIISPFPFEFWHSHYELYQHSKNRWSNSVSNPLKYQSVLISIWAHLLQVIGAWLLWKNVRRGARSSFSFLCPVWALATANAYWVRFRDPPTGFWTCGGLGQLRSGWSCFSKAAHLHGGTSHTVVPFLSTNWWCCDFPSKPCWGPPHWLSSQAAWHFLHFWSLCCWVC